MRQEIVKHSLQKCAAEYRYLPVGLPLDHVLNTQLQLLSEKVPSCSRHISGASVVLVH